MPWDGFDPYEKIVHPPTSTSPHNVPLSSAAMSQKDVKGDLPKNIGFRGRHNHGKSLDDPVYPSRPIPPSLKPRVLMDWRSGGRTMLASAMAMLERRSRLRTKPAIVDYGLRGFCSPRCGSSCAIEPRRILCGWFVPDTIQEHVNNMDDIARCFKGLVNLPKNKPLYTILNQVAEANATPAQRYEFCNSQLTPIGTPPEPGSDGYTSEDDPDANLPKEDIQRDARSLAEAQLYATNHTL